jgi:NAD(P)-dependent dehydrogenase (short-subunit alcohol dehydrogenase family)
MADIQRNERLADDLGENASFFHCNVADYTSQAGMFQAVWEQYGRIDALCANAGIVDKSSIYIFDHKGSEK